MLGSFLISTSKEISPTTMKHKWPNRIIKTWSSSLIGPSQLSPLSAWATTTLDRIQSGLYAQYSCFSEWLCSRTFSERWFWFSRQSKISTPISKKVNSSHGGSDLCKSLIMTIPCKLRWKRELKSTLNIDGPKTRIKQFILRKRRILFRSCQGMFSERSIQTFYLTTFWVASQSSLNSHWKSCTTQR